MYIWKVINYENTHYFSNERYVPAKHVFNTIALQVENNKWWPYHNQELYQV